MLPMFQETVIRPFPAKSRIVLNGRLVSSSFHMSMKFPIKLAQYFGFFPMDLNTTPLEFKWYYWRMLYSLVTFVFFLVEFSFVVYKTGKFQFTFLTISTFVFHLVAVVQFILFLKLTYQWPIFIKEWHKVESNMRSYETCRNLNQDIFWLTTLLMVFALVEHSLVNAYKLKNCFDNQPNPSEAFQVFFTMAYSHIFDKVAYSFWLGMLIQRTFFWSFVDLLIMLTGSALSFRLRQISRRIEMVSRLRVKDIRQWKAIRQDYIGLANLCEIVNEHMSTILIISFLNNLYFVLYQLFSSLRRMDNTVEKIYFYISFTFLLARVVGLCFFGGAVYEEWRSMLYYLGHVRTSAYNDEVERLTYHVSNCELSLSGKNFFHISRGLILKMAGAIVTYELVLIQFYKSELGD